MGFIAYRLLQAEGGPAGVRMYLECCEETDLARPSGVPAGGAPRISYSYAVDARFSTDRPGCTLSGVEDILALKKFYKLAFSLEERARERGGDWREVFCSEASLIEHLGYTRNARLLSDDQDEPRQRADSDALPQIHCAEKS